MTKDEALKLALEALEESLEYVEEEAENAQRLYGQYPTRQARIQGLKDDARKHMDAIIAIREALEQPAQQQEPVITKNEKGLTLHVGWDDLPAGTKLYTSPQPRKPWAGLTDDDIQEVRENCGVTHHAIKTIEAKLREKNA